ncbi:MAG: HrcA family transcriptional regulator [Campylobacteraceae bacterium]|jgi:heat-inducible transcriptional repressor|nr:HrcA family transcriptional regulator [Campylobacteraceae bacterium]
MKATFKQDLILEAIIKAYLEDNLPIGSAELQTKMPIEISASTIRAYFNKLCNEGILMQLHISGGRIPTVSALKKYWIEKLKTDTTIVLGSLSNIKNALKEYELYCALEFYDNEELKEVIKVQNRFLLLIFTNSEVTISYSDEAARFLNELLGFNVYDLRAISTKVGFSELCTKLDQMLVGKVLFQEGENVLYEMTRENDNRFLYDSFKNVRAVLELKDGIYFEEVVPIGYMAVKQRAKIGGNNAKMFCLGRVNTDFESFFNKAKEI